LTTYEGSAQEGYSKEQKGMDIVFAEIAITYHAENDIYSPKSHSDYFLLLPK